jgi:acetoin utilization deacetylase AcuC-like enzyme
MKPALNRSAIDKIAPPPNFRHRSHLLNNLPFISEELPERAELILAALQREQLGAIIAPSDHGLTPILKIHHADFITYLQHAHADWAAFHQQDTPVFPETFAVRPVRYKSKHTLQSRILCWHRHPIISGTWSAAY